MSYGGDLSTFLACVPNIPNVSGTSDALYKESKNVLQCNSVHEITKENKKMIDLDEQNSKS